MCPGIDILVMVRPISFKVCIMVYLSSEQSFSLFGGNFFRGHQISASKKPFDGGYLSKCLVGGLERYMSVRA